MRVIECEQGSSAWIAARLGVVTASNFDDILTPKKLGLSASHVKYLGRLVAEKVLGRPMEEVSSQFMERGIEMEEEARNWYAVTRHVDLVRVGFAVRDDGLLGCSPDSLVGEDGGLEAKAPAANTHAIYFNDPSVLVAEYKGQVQTCLGVFKRKWWDLLSYHPVMPKVVERCLPDPEYQDAVAKVLDGPGGFMEKYRAALAKIETAMELERANNPFI